MGLRSNYLAGLLGSPSGPLYDFTRQSTLAALGFYRSGSGTYVNASGSVVSTTETAPGSGLWLPRITHQPSTLTPLGALVEPQATQLYHSHSLASPALVTQNTTVTAQAYTLQFVGGGTVTLSGAHSATVVGLGAGLTKTYTFTASAGTLTSTPSGVCDRPQLEAGAVASSYLPHPGTGSLVRAADGNWDVSGAAFTALWTGTERTIIFEWIDTLAFVGTHEIFVMKGSSAFNEALGVYSSSTGGALTLMLRSGGNLIFPISATNSINSKARNKVAFSMGSGGYQVSLNGVAPTTTATTTKATLSSARFSGTTQIAGGVMQHVLVSIDSRPTAITGAALQALSAL